MANKSKLNGKSTRPAPRTITEPLFEAFPEPRSWALNWDGAALQNAMKAPGTQPKHTHS